VNTYAWKARETLKKWLSAIAATCLAAVVSDAAFKAAVDITYLGERTLRVIGIVGIVTGILGASPVGRLIFKDEDAPVPKDPPA
jgi:uncharacterized protein YjeT (DUF2065 family)